MVVAFILPLTRHISYMAFCCQRPCYYVLLPKALGRQVKTPALLVQAHYSAIHSKHGLAAFRRNLLVCVGTKRDFAATGRARLDDPNYPRQPRVYRHDLTPFSELRGPFHLLPPTTYRQLSCRPPRRLPVVWRTTWRFAVCGFRLAPVYHVFLPTQPSIPVACTCYYYLPRLPSPYRLALPT